MNNNIEHVIDNLILKMAPKERYCDFDPENPKLSKDIHFFIQHLRDKERWR